MKKLTLTEMSGSPYQCGRSYGEEFKHEIRAFYSKEIVSRKKASKLDLSYYEKQMRANTSLSYQFLKGMARGAKISRKKAVALLLHEEIYHNSLEQGETGEGHCTGVVFAPGSDDKTVLGQNWDWEPGLYNFPGVLKLKMDGYPSMLTYNYPGLPVCCGVNSEGLGLMWTGSGYGPVLLPGEGAPTYALAMEALKHRTLDDSLDYLKMIKNAGAFIFLLADSSGKSAVVEAMPGRMFIDRDDDVIYRANLFMNPDCIVASNQDDVDEFDHSVLRTGVLDMHFRKYRDSLDKDRLKKMLRSSGVFIESDDDTMTLDTIVADCDSKTLLVSRGGDPEMDWTEYSF